MAQTMDDVSFDTSDFFLGPANIPASASNSLVVQPLSGHSLDEDKMTSAVNPSSFEAGLHGSTSSLPTPESVVEEPASPANGPSTPLHSKQWIALGCITLLKASDCESGDEYVTSVGEAPSFRNMALLDRDGKVIDGECANIEHAQKRGLLRVEMIRNLENEDKAIARVYTLAEDVNRVNRPSPSQGRGTMKWLSKFIDRSPSTWAGQPAEESSPMHYDVPKSSREESLFYIFNTLESPLVSAEHFSATRYAQDAMADILEDEIQGLRTRLYPYQKTSVAAMLKREEDPAKYQDQRKPLYTDLEGQDFYMDVSTGAMFKSAHLYTEPRGGILAESMGYGKTIICIALILATRGFYPALPEARLDRPREDKYAKTPSLLSMAARSLRHAAVPWKAPFYALQKQGYHYTSCLEEIQRYYREFGEPIFNPSTPDRKVSKREAFRTLRLCSATLIIVPPNLVVQWKQELEKHTDPGALDVLVLDMSSEAIPPWQELMSYDIVLISKNRLEKEYREDDLHQGKRFRGEDKYHSSLTDVRWLRVICDEGHGFAGSSTRTNAIAMLDKMSIERRWIISGTPSNSMHGIEISLAAKETQPEPRQEFLTSELEQRRTAQSAKDEEKDMEKLRLIAVNFLKISPWANQKGQDQANWKKYFQPFDAEGKRRHSPSLRPLLQSLMIRHRIEDIDSHLTLPPLFNRTVYLEPSFYDKLSLNLFTMALTSNAITSERVDEDYMHHPKNRKNLEILINNLRQSTFHWVGWTAEEVSKTIAVSNSYFDKHIDTITDGDGVLLTKAIQEGERALCHPGWKAFSVLHEVGVYISDFPEGAAAAWSIHGEVTKPLLLGVKQALDARAHIQKHVSEVDPTSGLIGAGMRAMNEAKKRAEEDNKQVRSSKGSTASPSKPASAPAGTSEEPKLNPTVPSARLNSSRKRPRSSLTHADTHLSITATVSAKLALPKIIRFTSSKLTYLCSRLLSTPSDIKTIVFYDQNNIAYWLAESLDLLDIPHLIYSNTLKQSTRSEWLARFNAEPQWRVLLMDLKQASHGLHVAAASQVFIISPIWNPGVEAQAIKRAHRIGQTRAVHVETLILKDTIEERMWRRRKGMEEGEFVGGGAGAGKGKGMGGKMESGGWLDDAGVVGIIKREHFLGIGDEGEGEVLTQPVGLFVRDEKFHNVEQKEQRDESGAHQARLKKRRKVMFSDELRPHIHRVQQNEKDARPEIDGRGKPRTVEFALPTPPSETGVPVQSSRGAQDGP